jgi:RNA polymerase sigma factor (sigma-70 family)
VTPGSQPNVDHLLRDLAPQVLGALLRRFGDINTCEDAVQEALFAAAVQWPERGVPENPRGWLIQVAFRRLTDHLRSEGARRRREERAATQIPSNETMAGAAPVQGHDDTLVLLFMCCHPSLSSGAAIALTLRAVGGLTTAEIAKAFMVPESTMAQRVSRAKKRIRSSNIPFRMPTEKEWPERLRAVLHVLYLMFNEGYTSTFGSALNHSELSTEAIRLTRTVHRLLPENAEVAGLLALMLLTDARRSARTGPGGELIPLAEQDRSRWDEASIVEGVALVTGALSKGSVGYYQLQAAIAAIHDEATDADATDWPQILALYGLLRQMTDNPMVLLNHAIATAMVYGPATGLVLLDVLDGDDRMAGHYRLDAVRGHLLEMAGDRRAAVGHYRAAASGTRNMPERHYLIKRAARLASEGE